MKHLIAAILIATPFANAHAFLFDILKPILRPPSTQPVPAPEIDGASGALVIALAGGGLALLQRSRRRRDESSQAS